MKLYVTGGTGLVGSNLIRCARAQDSVEIIATQFGPPPVWQVDYELDPLDISDAEAVRRSIEKYRPDAVIHTAASVDQVWMRNNRERAWAIMVESTMAFARACRATDARFVFVSTDWVFDGMVPLVTEFSPPLPVNFYGIMKAVCEQALGAMDDLSYGVGRLAGVYGLNYALPAMLRREQSLGFEMGVYVAEQVTRGRVAEIWSGPNTNMQAHPTLASDCADMLLRLARSDANGIFHCFGSESIGRLDFARAVARAFDADSNLVAAAPTDPMALETHAGIRIPYRTCASVEHSSAVLGRRAMNVAEGTAAFREEWDAFHDGQES